MLPKSRFVIALGLILALGISGVAFGTASVNDAKVDGKVTPKKLDKKKYKPVNLFLGVRNDYGAAHTGQQANPASELISVGKNVKVNLGKADRCQVTLASGTPTETAKSQCPKGSFIGRGKGEVQGPGGAVIGDPVVSVFVGPGKNELQLHTYDQDLGSASPVVPAKIVKAKGKKFGQALKVPAAPETGALLITKFNATIMKSTKVATARCMAKKMIFQRKVTYKDGSKETVTKSQKCKRR